MTTVYLRHENDAAGEKLGDIPLAELTHPDFDLPARVGRWGIDTPLVGGVDATWLSGQFVYEPGGRGACFEVVIGTPDGTSDET